MTQRWAYGVTTVPQRRGDLLPRTILSLKRAGFGEPRLFVDGTGDAVSWVHEFGLEVTTHYPAIRTAGNWFLALAELWFRHQEADRYAINSEGLCQL